MLNRIKLALLIFYKPYLVSPAILINKAAIRGTAKATARVNYNDGSYREIEYTLVASQKYEKDCIPNPLDNETRQYLRRVVKTREANNAIQKTE